MHSGRLWRQTIGSVWNHWLRSYGSNRDTWNEKKKKKKKKNNTQCLSCMVYIWSGGGGGGGSFRFMSAPSLTRRLGAHVKTNRICGGKNEEENNHKPNRTGRQATHPYLKMLFNFGRATLFGISDIPSWTRSGSHSSSLLALVAWPSPKRL